MKKVLIITYYWPPAGGPGVQRWMKFVKYLKDFEVEPIVYIPENPDYPLLDQSLLREVPEDITILKQEIFEPYFLAKFFSGKQTKKISSGIIPAEKNQSLLQKFLLYIRGNFFIPDARKFWIKPSVKYLKDYIQKNNIEVIITTGPPHSVHLIGAGLKEKAGVKWFADFRDPWTQIGYHKKIKLTESSRKKHEELEKKVLQEADHIITTSYTTRKEFIDKTSKPISVITNGFDEDEIADFDIEEHFTVAHIGSLLSGRDPQNLWKVFGELVIENKNFGKDFKLKLIGAVSDDVLRSIGEYIPSENMEIAGYVNHDEALRIQRGSQVLLLVEINSEETRGIIPGKVFEYMAAGPPILALGPEGWDVEKLLKETGAGDYYNYKEHQKLKRQIISYYELFKNNNLRGERKNIEQFSRRNLTGQLAKILKQ